ncbi:MAG: T9SS type A sorting domain-containing protein [Rhodothermales bacterium]
MSQSPGGIVVAWFFVVVTAAISQSSIAGAQPQELTSKFEVRAHTFQGFTMPYRLYVPETYDGSRAHPLIVTFHGSGERGTNNTSQIAIHRIATAWADTRVQSLYAPFVVSPQVPPNGRWEDVVLGSSSAPIRKEMATVLDLLDSLSVEFNIDQDRVYATGLSLGGYGTFDAVYRDPSRFAAALAMSGGYSPLLADSIGNVPFWIIHGETDGTVSPLFSKNMVTAFERLGREAFYTNCGYFNCHAKSSVQLDSAMATRPDLVFMGVPNVGHGPWAPWYDDPRIEDWLLSKHRLRPGLLSILSPSLAELLQGTASLQWTGGEVTDSVEVMFSATPAEGWMRLAGPILNAGSLEIDTSLLPDTPFGRFEIVLLNADGLAVAREKSPFFVIDNAGDSPPVIELIDLDFRTPISFMGDSIDLMLRAGDPESDSLAAILSYSSDGGSTFSALDDFDMMSAPDIMLKTVDLTTLPNADEAVFRVEVTDGVNTSFARSPAFRKATPRETSTYVQHPEGSGSARVRISFVDPEELTGHKYRVSFQVPEDAQKTYSVRDLDTNTEALVNAPVTGFEGPAFDGIRLTIFDVVKAEEDRDLTGWTVGDATLNASIRSPRVSLGGESIQCLATPADYRITFHGETVDTTSSLFDFDPVPIRFEVQNLTSGGSRDVLFDDADANAIPSNGERMYILEKDGEGQLLPAWMFTFVRGNPDRGPEDGDVFELVTRKPANETDVYDFVGMIGVGVERDEVPPAGFRLYQNYPNPFSDATTIPYELDGPAAVALSVYDVLGRQIGSFDEGLEQPGVHRIRFTMRLPAGVYFYRLRVGNKGSETSSTSRMLVVH